MCRANMQIRQVAGPAGVMCPLHSVMSGGCPRVPIPVSEQMADTYTDIDIEPGTTVWAPALRQGFHGTFTDLMG